MGLTADDVVRSYASVIAKQAHADRDVEADRMRLGARVVEQLSNVDLWDNPVTFLEDGLRHISDPKVRLLAETAVDRFQRHAARHKAVLDVIDARQHCRHAIAEATGDADDPTTE